jgi:hypothetical protein
MSEKSKESAWERRRRLAEVFGEVLPEVTRDEQEPGERTGDESATDRWLKSQVPPHHG